MTDTILDLSKNTYFKTLQEVGEVADSLGYECYVVGGFVRDFLLNKENDDIDFVVVGKGLEIAKAVGTLYNGKVSLYESYGTAKVDANGLELEFVGARKEFYHRESRNPIVEDGTIQDDMDRRDLTINDMAICVNANRFGALIDPHGGIKDLANKIIRTPLDPNITFSDDPLRMLRAIRFATRLGFEIEENTLNAIRNNFIRIKIISKERICEELEKMMCGPDPARAIRILNDTQLLVPVLPWIASLNDTLVAPNGRTHKNIFDHTIKVLDFVAKNTTDEWTRWAALFHDVAKPYVRKWDGHNWTFENHGAIGGKWIRQIFKNLCLPLDERMLKVQKLVSLHMRPMQLCDEGVTDSAVRRILFDAGEDIDDLMILCNADITSHNKGKVDQYRKNYDILVQRMKDIEETDRLRNFQPPVDGNEIMEMFNLKPCRLVGDIKNAVKDAILDGEIHNDREEAINFINNFVANHKDLFV